MAEAFIGLLADRTILEAVKGSTGVVGWQWRRQVTVP
jgi:hypothetical protein